MVSYPDPRLKGGKIKGETCKVAGCYTLSSGVSRLCAKHDWAYQHVGHPEAQSITYTTLTPYLRLADHYLGSTWQDHREATEAAARLGRWLTSTFPTLPRKFRKPEAAIRIVVALYLAQEHDPGLFKSDRHFAFTLANRTIRSVYKLPRNARFGSRELTRYSQQIVKEVGVNSLAMALAIKRANTTPEGLLLGVNLPVKFPDKRRREFRARKKQNAQHLRNAGCERPPARGLRKRKA